MTLVFSATEVCATCGTDASDGRYFCDFYSENQTTRLTFCTPRCAEAYLHGEKKPALPKPVNGERWKLEAAG
jgi:hypothetical protein